ncbi:hypothetical protein ACFOOP_19180 [Marinicaulis aureus]|uniref:Uncharacterized protein n=1 Tax=Hyphococcus aureus TaxID=2666033 RepID=A0ABW1KV48_9PROT
MILRRVIAHFRKQEWTAIALDFLIVVVGVFIGIQVSNWNDVRRERATEVSYLQTLQSDFTISVGLLDEHLAHIAERQEALSVLANSAKEDVKPEDFDGLMRIGLYELQFLNVHRGAYQALENAGRIDVLQDIALQRSLVDQSNQIAAIREYEADMARFQHRWVDEFLLAEYRLGNVVDFDGVEQKKRGGGGEDYRDLLDDPRIRNLSAFLYDILNEQRAHGVRLRDTYDASAGQAMARLEQLGNHRKQP